MAKAHVYWRGISGNYGYFIYRIGTVFKDEPGNYIYAKETSTSWIPVYIGQTSSLKDRLANHEKEECAKKNGATRLHAHTQSRGEVIRLAEESDLVRKWDPVCNG